MKKKNLIILIIIVLFFMCFLINMRIFEPDHRLLSVLIIICFVISLIGCWISIKIEKKHKKIYESMVPVDCEEPSIDNNEAYRLINDKKKQKEKYDSMVPIDCGEPSIDNNEVYRFTNDEKTKIICIYKNGNVYKYSIYEKLLEDDSYDHCKYYYWTVLDNGRVSLFDTKEKALDEALKDIGIENNN